MNAAKVERSEPSVNPDTIMERIAEIVRMVAALTSEVCYCSEDGKLGPVLPNAGMVGHRLMLAHAQLARALAPAEEIDAEAQRGLEMLKDGHGELYQVVASFLADIASYPGDPTWNVNSHLPSRYLLPSEPSEVERKRIDRALKVAAKERRARSAAWCSATDDDDESEGAS